MLSVIPGALVAFLVGSASVTAGYEALEDQSREHLTSIRDTTASTIESYFGAIKRQILTSSNNRMMIDAMREFDDGFARGFFQKARCILR